jgi:hypothetical protein
MFAKGYDQLSATKISIPTIPQYPELPAVSGGVIVYREIYNGVIPFLQGKRPAGGPGNAQGLETEWTASQA